MGDEKQPEPPQKTGPCFFGEEHSFTLISATDPFTGVQTSELRCTGCGAGG